MCIMFRDKWIIRFLSLHFAVTSVYISIKWQKKYQETSRELKIFKGMFLELANADINIACLLSGRKHRIVITRSCTNLMIIKLSKIQIQTKASPLKPRRGLHLYALLRHQTLSVIAPIFLKSSLELVCEIHRVPIFVRVFFILSIRNLDLQIKQKEIFKGKASLLTWQSQSRPQLKWTCVTSGFI